MYTHTRNYSLTHSLSHTGTDRQTHRERGAYVSEYIKINSIENIAYIDVQKEQCVTKITQNP